MRFSRLSALIAIMAVKFVVTIFAGSHEKEIKLRIKIFRIRDCFSDF